jgi:prepilin-type N-terminal cleavage/methylation domain-containing protein/prepilin-type processing-associated H-X9-DG protein
MASKIPIKKKGFTLIELLVVIAIIALLLAILMPALTKVKEVASAVVCGSNIRQLTTAWMSYASDNDDGIPGSNCGENYPQNRTKAYDWVQMPRDATGTLVSIASATVEDRIRGIEAGTLYPYIKDSKVYHCPSDRRDSKENTYRSYGMPGSMNGGFHPESFTKYTAVRNPSERYVFLEEKTDIGGFNWGAWGIPPTGNKWLDPVMSWHGKGTELGFADGHVERHVLLQKSTVAMMDVPYSPPPGCIGWLADDGVDDLRYMQRGYWGN